MGVKISAKKNFTQNLFLSAIIDEAGKAFGAESACMRVKILKSVLFLARSGGFNALSY